LIFFPTPCTYCKMCGNSHQFDFDFIQQSCVVGLVLAKCYGIFIFNPTSQLQASLYLLP